MVYRYSWIAGIAGIGLAFLELSSILRASDSGTSWQVAIIVAVLLSMGVTWTALAYRANVWLAMIGNVVAYVLVVGLLVAPDTLWGIFPTADTFTVIQVELAHALDIIQHSAEPVRPVPGLIMLLAGLFWILGFLLVAGLLNSRPFVAVLTPIIIALQFVIIDRRPKGLVHIAIFVGVAAFALVAVRLDERDQGTGRLARTNAVTAPSRRPSFGIAMLLILTIVASLGSVALVGDRVPSDGVVSWRSPSGYSDDYSSGSGTYDLFVDIQANLITQSRRVEFVATFKDGVDPASVRFRLATLDRFRDGGMGTSLNFQASRLDDEPWISEAQKYRGPTTPIAVAVEIVNLSMSWLPTPVTPTAAAIDDSSDSAALRVRRLDGSLYLPGDITREGMAYAVVAEIPRFTAADFAQLARDEDGGLSPLFAAAEDDGRDLGSITATTEFEELPDEEYWTEYPEDVGPRVGVEARRVTANMDTNFERALALEDYFRSSGGFTYNTSVPRGFTTDDYEKWLFDDTYEFRRSGYCEQFALTMALMARTLGVPSRVVYGFTPGRLLNDNTVEVLGLNAHSWVEIWIPSHGWMAFDPTPRGDYTLPTTNDAFREALGFAPADYAPEIPAGTLLDLGGLDPLLEALLAGRDDIDRTLFTPSGTDAPTSRFTLPDWANQIAGAIAFIALIAAAAPVSKWFRRRRRARRLARGDIAAAWEDITERLSDLGETVDAAATPLEMADSIDEAFVPLARSYGDALYGEKTSTTAVIDRATDAHTRAEQHLTTRYSRSQRIRAAYRPTRLKRRLTRMFSRSKN